MNETLVNQELGYDEIADSIADLLEVADAIAKSQADGLGVDDLLVLWNVYPKLREVYEDRKVAIAQFLDLKGDEPMQVLAIVAERTKGSVALIQAKIVPVLAMITRTYRFGNYTIDEGKALFADWKVLFDSFRPQIAA